MCICMCNTGEVIIYKKLLCNQNLNFLTFLNFFTFLHSKVSIANISLTLDLQKLVVLLGND